jgi:spore coat polysaccharide biosynthesis protein SpsF
MEVVRMLQTLGIVQVDSNSTVPRLKSGRGLEGRSLLDWAIRRVTDCERLDAVIVVAPRAAASGPLAALVPPDVPVHFSRAHDELGRLVDAVSEFRAEAIVRISIDHPLVDPVLLDRLVIDAAEHPGIDYLGFCLPDGRPAVRSPVGLFGEWFRTTALIRAHRDGAARAPAQSVTDLFCSHPEMFQLRLLSIPLELQRDDFRLAIDNLEDWEHTQAIFDALGTEHVDWQRIAGLLDHQPALRQRMGELNRAAPLADVAAE